MGLTEEVASKVWREMKKVHYTSLCGAPLVNADPAIAGVVGLFHLQSEDKKICLCAVLK